MDVREGSEWSEHTHAVPLRLPARVFAALCSVRPSLLIILSSLWVVLVIVAVLSGVCFVHNCKKLQTISYAADREPMTSIYSVGLTLFICAASPFFVCLHHFCETKLRLIQCRLLCPSAHATARPAAASACRLLGYPQRLFLGVLRLLARVVCPRQEADAAQLLRLLAVLRAVFAFGLVCMFVQCLVPLHVSKPLHNQGGFLFLFASVLWVGGMFTVLDRTRVCAADDAVLRRQLRMMQLLAVLATGTVVQASFAYSHRSFYFNSRILAVFEAATAIAGCLFPLTFLPYARTMYVDGSFDPSIFRLWSLKPK
eukprot:TRINITY_DN13257_c0_g1_i1.p1 TRINITY_DN13257_c0_g1~~TRINITY_DN13257_c0_g1_i1.p1  ORF type:complete len:312 (-),score=105.44 TRINITY_DN13257_c0_g1_i1:64-999(-)